MTAALQEAFFRSLLSWRVEAEMADRKISALAALTAPADNDLFVVVDASEAADADKNKSLTFEALHRSVGDGTASPSISF